MAEMQPVAKTRQYWVLFALAITFMFNFLDRQIMALLVTPIKQDLELSDTQISLLIGFAFVIFYALAGIPISRLVDRGSRKWIIGIGVAFWSLMTMACGLAQNFAQLALARIGLGVGESCNTPAAYSLVTDLFPKEKLARAIAVINLGNVGGQGFAFFAGGSLILWLSSGPFDGIAWLEDMRPWQLTFMILGLPGILWAFIFVATVPEAPRRKEVGSEFEAPSLADVLRFVLRWKWVYLPLILGITIKAMLSFGAAIWSPALLERKFGWETGTPGLYLGMIGLTAMPAGLLLGGWLADKLTERGHANANVLVLLGATAALVPFAIVFPLMPTAGTALAMQAASLFFGAIGTSPGNAAMQLVTPGRMRGTVTAFYIAIMNVLGNGLGPLIIALTTDRVFRAESMLPYSMSMTAVLLGPIGIAMCWITWRNYERAAEAADARMAVA